MKLKLYRTVLRRFQLEKFIQLDCDNEIISNFAIYHNFYYQLFDFPVLTKQSAIYHHIAKIELLVVKAFCEECN